MSLIQQLKVHEGDKKFPYKDTVGKITIGVGRNLTDVGLSEDEIEYLLANDIKRVFLDLDSHLPWWRTLDQTRQDVLADMCFNMGIGGLMQFKNTLAAIQAHDWSKASAGMLASTWAKQVGKRAVTLAQMMETGIGPDFR